MNVNDDFTKRVMLHSDAIEWEESPMAGVERRRLDRVNAQNDRVTTIVRYAAGSAFSSHVHTGGEEFIVLEGIFEDDYGQWPAGSYIRNPPHSSHTPASTDGCIIFVKLWQFQPDDRTFVHAQRHKLGSVDDRQRSGVKVSPLYKDTFEEVCFEQWAANENVTIEAPGGAEILVLEGGFTEGADTLRKHSWLRMPEKSVIRAKAGAQGATIWMKTGHISSTQLEIGER